MQDDSHVLADFADSDQAFAIVVLNDICQVVLLPCTWSQAKNGPRGRRWMGAYKIEYTAIEANGTFEKVLDPNLHCKPGEHHTFVYQCTVV